MDLPSKYCIVTIPLVPLRAVPAEAGEMTSQLLFGQIAEILETKDKWCKIKNVSDGYQGFADRKTLTVLTENDLEFQKTLKPVKISVPTSTIRNAQKQPVILTFGSTLWLNRENICLINREKYTYDAAHTVDFASATADEILGNAKKFINAPYLWGGKSMFGVDCSGLVQLVFANTGILLPRDAAQQAAAGARIASIAAARQGDLAFCENKDGKIVHVGILLNNREIIHASGCVKIESIDSKGIISLQTGEYTHKLSIIKRII
ncbi:MAG: C40 family peptidase [Prevotellaceae bacterium]|jgi:cell wall-associated NlpC family hydrolase|nr:C40 family peptidase [Prevotellaceae bacterium]